MVYALMLPSINKEINNPKDSYVNKKTAIWFNPATDANFRPKGIEAKITPYPIT